MESILLDSYIAKIVSRCSQWRHRDPDEEGYDLYPLEEGKLIVEPGIDGKGVIIVATDGHILCRGTDHNGFTPHKEPVFVDRPTMPEGYGFDRPESAQITTVKSSIYVSQNGKHILNNWKKAATAKHPFAPTEYPMINPSFLGCILPIQLRMIRTYGPDNAVHFLSECGRFKWALMPMRTSDRLGFCGDTIEVRNWNLADQKDEK